MRWLVFALALGCDEPAPLTQRPSPEPSFSARHARALKMAGIKNATPATYEPFGCSDSDSFMASAGFVANGVRGNICCGFMKGCVVRTQ
jgi:hypothetical protein